MISEKIKKTNRKWIFITILICFMFLNIFLLFFSYNYKTSIPINNRKSQTLLQGYVVDQWIKESHEKDWIDDSEFNTGQDWSIVKSGSDINDVDASISGGQANCEILGDYKTLTIKADPPTSTNWTRVKNLDFPIFPDTANFDRGCHISHYWDEDENQSVSVHWEQNVTLNEDMSDYRIVSGQVWAKVNATVHANNGIDNGIEAYKDATGESNTHNATFDYARFYVQVSDLNKNEVYEIAYYQTISLGNDSSGEFDDLYDTFMIPIPEESLKFYLSSILNYDHHNFTITLGIRLWSEDNWLNDDDNWDHLRIKSFNMTFNYIKKIDQFTSIYFKYDRNDKLDTKKGRIEITSANMNFDLKTNTNWELISQNSEIKIQINDQEHKESFKLIDAQGTFEEVKDNDFDLTSLIPTDEELVIVLKFILADEFYIGNDISISIDNVELEITYDIFLPAEQSLLFEIILIVIVLAAVLLISYFIYYQRVLKYPKPIRKLRKFKKTLKRKSPPNVSIIGRNDAFNNLYNKKTTKVSELFRTKKTSPDIVEPKSNGKKLKRFKSKNKSIDKLKDSFKNKNALIVFLILMFLFLSVIIVFAKTPTISTYTTQKNTSLILSQNSDNEQWTQISHSEQWIKNSEFDNDEGWDSDIIGDNTDVSAKIDDGEATYDVLGKSYSFIAASGKPNASEYSMGWKQLKNSKFPSLPDVAKINSSGCFVSHNWWSEWADQSPSVQWEKNITMPVDMSDYIITSASISAIVNGTALTQSASGYSYYGCEAGNDSPEQNATKDYVRFYILVSDLEKEKVYETAYYQTKNLGQDTPQISSLNNTYMIPASEEFLKFFLTSVLNSDHRHFTIALGIRIWCEDNFNQDQDTWTSLIINSFDLNFQYIKKINQATSISWDYEGEKIEEENIEITDGKLYFDYVIDKIWTSSPNSEMRILINDELFGETFKLSKFRDNFEEADKDGLDVTELIPEDEKISVKIQIYIGDEFGLGSIYTISIDNVILEIEYNEILPAAQSLLIQILIIIGAVGLVCLATYIVYYQRVLKYPKPVRKVRKYRRNIKKNKDLKIKILNRENAFYATYKSKSGNAENLLKTPLSKNVLDEERGLKEDVKMLDNNLKGSP